LKRIKAYLYQSRLRLKIIAIALLIILFASLPISTYFLYKQTESIAYNLWTTNQSRASKIENAVRSAGTLEKLDKIFWTGMEVPNETR